MSDRDPPAPPPPPPGSPSSSDPSRREPASPAAPQAPPPPPAPSARTDRDPPGPPTPDGDVVIAARGVRREFGKEVALEGLDLRIPRGCIYGFVGPSGSGKTTAVRLLTGIDLPSAGEVEILGRAAADVDRHLRRRIGYMPQASVQFPNLSARENLSFVASLYGLPLRRKTILEQALRRTELHEHRKKPVRELSGGMQRRLALSAALVHDPEVLFLDEPTAGIDPVLRRKLWDQFEALRDEGHTLFVTTQYVSEAAYCDRVGVLAAGRLIADDTPQELRRRALGGDVLELTTSQSLEHATVGELNDLDGVHDVQDRGERMRLRVVVDAADRRLPLIQDWCRQRQVGVESLGEEHVGFDDVFAVLMQEAETTHEEPTAR